MPSERVGERCDKDSRSIQLHFAKLCIKKSGYFGSKAYFFSICNDTLKAQPIGMFQFGSYQVYSKAADSELSMLDSVPKMTLEDSEQSQNKSNRFCKTTKHSKNSKFSNKRWKKLGLINSPGILSDRSIVIDANNRTQAAILYENTSRTGDLMNMTAAIPCVRKTAKRHINSIICSSTILNTDCASVITEYTGEVFWSEDVLKISASEFTHFIKNKKEKITIMKNKLPSWNSHINAYTLEFGGRALIPSVHNFQLVDKDNNIILQLGKVSQSEFNVDFSFPLSPFQAFTVCLSVIDRSFVWD